jgi:hypothetical protein
MVLLNKRGSGKHFRGTIRKVFIVPPDFDNQGTWGYGRAHPWLRAERVINKSLTST